MRVDLEPARDLTERLGAPQRAYSAIHVAGTKGKGSVCALVAAALEQLGLRVGVYASPHVESVNERIRVNEAPVDDEAFAEALERALAAREDAVREGTSAVAATWFDVLTVAALDAFREARVQIAVVECGLGGRLDSTNVLQAAVCGITNVDIEHAEVLGRTRRAIAAEKAGILHRSALLVHSVGSPDDEAATVVEEVARALGAPAVAVSLAADAPIAERNAALAGALLEAAGRRIPEARGRDGRAAGAWLLSDAVRRSAALPGRAELRWAGGVPVLLDGAHVPSSLSLLLRELESDSRLPGRPVLIVGLGRDKDALGFLKLVQGRVDRVLCTSAGDGPYLDPRELLQVATGLGLQARALLDPADALNDALQVRKKRLGPGHGFSAPDRSAAPADHGRQGHRPMLTIVSDLLLTDAFMIKGQVENKYTRLSQLLDEFRKYFIKVRDATLIDLNSRDRIHTPLLHVNVDEVLLAHELIETAGDPHAARLTAADGVQYQRVRTFYTGNLNVEVAGLVRPGCYEADDRSTRRFFVMQRPEVRGMKLDGDRDLELLSGLSYAILNKTRLSYVYDFND